MIVFIYPTTRRYNIFLLLFLFIVKRCAVINTVLTNTQHKIAVFDMRRVVFQYIDNVFFTYSAEHSDTWKYGVNDTPSTNENSAFGAEWNIFFSFGKKKQKAPRDIPTTTCVCHFFSVTRRTTANELLASLPSRELRESDEPSQRDRSTAWRSVNDTGLLPPPPAVSSSIGYI